MAEYIEQIVWHEVERRPLTDEEYAEYKTNDDYPWNIIPSYIFENEMPEDGQEILISTKLGTFSDVCSIDCENGNNLYYLEGGDWDDVIAWAAMPRYKVIIESAFGDDTSKAERIRELLKADGDGRIVILPCKVGDTVWFKTYTDNGKTCIGLQPHKAVSVRVCVMADGRIFPVELLLSRFGKSWFITREEAEKALEVMKDD